MNAQIVAITTAFMLIGMLFQSCVLITTKLVIARPVEKTAQREISVAIVVLMYVIALTFVALAVSGLSLLPGAGFGGLVVGGLMIEIPWLLAGQPSASRQDRQEQSDPTRWTSDSTRIWELSRATAAAARADRTEHLDVDVQEYGVAEGVVARCYDFPHLDRMELLVETTRADWGKKVLPIRVSAGTEGTDYLLALGSIGSSWSGRIVVPVHFTDVTIAFGIPPIDSDGLGAADVPAIERSLIGASDRGLALWQEMAANLPDNHPIKLAVQAGMGP
jgi:hypothetical protein